MKITRFTHPKEVFQHLANLDAEVECQVFLPTYEGRDDQHEDEFRLSYTSPPPIPFFLSVKPEENKASLWGNFYKKSVYQLKP